MSDLGDFGVKAKGGDTDDYDVLYSKDLEPGDTFTGEAFLSEIKISDYDDKPYMVLVITNHDLEEKWVINYKNPKVVVDNDGTELFYGKKGGKLYTLIDSLLSALFDITPGEAKYHSVVAETFRDAINSKVISVDVEAVESLHPLAKAPIVRVASATMAE